MDKYKHLYKDILEGNQKDDNQKKQLRNEFLAMTDYIEETQKTKNKQKFIIFIATERAIERIDVNNIQEATTIVYRNKGLYMSIWAYIERKQAYKFVTFLLENEDPTRYEIIQELKNGLKKYDKN